MPGGARAICVPSGVGEGLAGQQVHGRRAARSEDENGSENGKTENEHVSGDSRQGCFHQLRPIAGADRQDLVVEIVARDCGPCSRSGRRPGRSTHRNRVSRRA